MNTLNPYLNFAGNTEEAFNFYCSALNGQIINLQRFSDTPHGAQLPENERNMIMHIALQFGKSGLLMGTDTLASAGHKLTAGNNFSLALHTDSEAEADAVFAKLGEGATIEMPLQKTFWGAYFGMLTDKFGTKWLINYDYPKQ